MAGEVMHIPSQPSPEDAGWIEFQEIKAAEDAYRRNQQLTTGTADEGWQAFQRQAERGEL